MYLLGFKSRFSDAQISSLSVVHPCPLNTRVWTYGKESLYSQTPIKWQPSGKWEMAA